MRGRRTGQAVPGIGVAHAIPVLRGACAFGLVSRTLGRLRSPPWGYYGPCARSSLTARLTTGHASADRSWSNAERHSLEPQQSVERRAGLRHWPVISGDPEMDPAARRVIGCGASAPAPVGALLPLIFRGVEKDKGASGAPRQPAAER